MVYDDIQPDLLAGSPFVRRPAPYGVLRVQGPDARDFLHRMCSQDLHALGDSDVLPAAFLDGKGKLLAVCFLGAVGDAVWLSVQADTVVSLAEMLDRFHFSEALTVEAFPELDCAEILGSAAIDGVPSGCTLFDGGVRFVAERHGVHFARIHAPTSSFDDAAAWNPHGFAEISTATADALRIVSNEAWVGTDSEPNTLALELPIEDHISTTKGCYTGQEIVARIHTYGHTNRALRRLRIAGVGPIEPGTTLVETDEGEPVGRVMSSAELPDGSGRLAFGFVASVLGEPGTRLGLGDASGPEVVVL